MWQTSPTAACGPSDSTTSPISCTTRPQVSVTRVTRIRRMASCRRLVEQGIVAVIDPPPSEVAPAWFPSAHQRVQTVFGQYNHRVLPRWMQQTGAVRFPATLRAGAIGARAIMRGPPDEAGLIFPT